jgi:NADPH:quinone reductase-like Zn-dependent oxidoreductase
VIGVAAVQHQSSWRGLARFATVRLGSIGASQRAAMYITNMNQADMEVLRDLLQAGKVTPVIDSCYRLDEILKGFHYFDEAHARGKIVIDCMW